MTAAPPASPANLIQKEPTRLDESEPGRGQHLCGGSCCPVSGTIPTGVIRKLFDGQRSVHAGFTVSGNRAVVLDFPAGIVRNGERRRL